MRILQYRFLPAVAVLLTAVQATAANGRIPYRLGIQETLNRVRVDLNRAVQNTLWPTAGEARRLERVRHRVAEFQNKWDHGRLDHAALHALIESLEDVVERNRLTSRDRMALRSDLERLRAVQELYENYGYR